MKGCARHPSVAPDPGSSVVSTRWQQINDLFHSVRDLDPDAREEALQSVHDQDPPLYEEVRALLAADVGSGVFDELMDRFGQPVGVPDPAPHTVGTQIGPYRIIHELGRGGMGTVYLAERADGQFEQRVALKLGRFGMLDEALLHRFLNERQILARLVHPHIARLYDGGITAPVPDMPGESRPWFAMEYVEGQSIDSYCDERRLSVDDRLRLFEDICSAVLYAHQNLIVHRDLKPSNILVTAGGEVKLLDFGISKLMSDDDESQALTQTGLHAMTPEYASPEQIRGEPITTASDVYSLGLILYQLLTGRRPYEVAGRSAAEIERLVCHQLPARPSTVVRPDRAHAPNDVDVDRISALRSSRPERLRRRLSGDLDTIVLRALQKEPARRYQSAEQLLEDVRRHASSLPVRARPDSLSYRTTRFVRRHRVGVAAALVGTLSLATGIAGVLWQARVAAHERDQARLEAAKSEEVASFLEDLFNASDPYLSTMTDRPDTLRVRHFLRRGADRVLQELQDQPAVQARMLNVAGNVYRSLGLLDEAAPLVERGLAIRNAMPDADERDVAESLHSLAVVQHARGDYETADSLFAASLQRLRATPASPDLPLARVLVDHGELLRDVERLDEARRALNEGLEIQRAALGPENLDVANTLYRLGTVHHIGANLNEAEPLYAEALRVQRRILGNRHPTVAATLVAISGLLLEKVDVAAAEPLAREAYDIRRETFGEHHPESMTALYQLAMILRERGRSEEAVQAFQRVVAFDRDVLGEDHEYVGLATTELGITLYRMGRYPEAEQAFREAVEMLRQSVPDNSFRIGNALLALGHVQIELDRPERCAPLVREGLELQEQALGAENWRVGVARSTLGGCFMAEGRFAEAEPYLLDGYQLLVRTGGPTRAALERLVAFYERTNRPSEATKYRAATARLSPPGEK